MKKCIDCDYVFSCDKQVVGTISEIAEKFNVKKNTARFWTTSANKRRLASRRGGNSQGKLAIRIEDEL